MPQENAITVVVTKDGTYGFVGEQREAQPDMVMLAGALTLAYKVDNGEPYLTFGQLPMPLVTQPNANVCTAIPRENVSYMVRVPRGEGHPLEQMYDDFFRTQTVTI